MPTDAYKAGGFAPVEGERIGEGASDFLGRLWNNISGKTASNQVNIDEAEKARVFSSSEAAKNRDWETMMSNTAYQRAVADMKAAGLNPAAIGGEAASTPSAPQAPSAAAAQAVSGGSGGLLGLVAKIASAAIAGSIAKKFQNTAKMAGSAAGAVKNVDAVATSVKTALKQCDLAHEADYLRKKQSAQERKLLALAKGVQG